jgi:hypothetical protein
MRRCSAGALSTTSKQSAGVKFLFWGEPGCMSPRYDGTLTPGVQGAPSHVVIQSRGHPGLLAGLLGCVLAVLGIFTLGFVFVPLAALCALVGLLRGISGFNASGIGTSLLAASYVSLDLQRPRCWWVSREDCWQPTHSREACPPYSIRNSNNRRRPRQLRKTHCNGRSRSLRKPPMNVGPNDLGASYHRTQHRCNALIRRCYRRSTRRTTDIWT